MNRTLVIIVIAVAIGGMVAGGIMVWGYTTQTGKDAIATPVIGTPQPPPPPPELIEVDAAQLSLDGFALGLAEKAIRKTGKPFTLRFQKKPLDGEVVEYFAVPKRPKRFHSVRLLVAAGEVVAYRIKYTKPRRETYDKWKGLLQKPYFIDEFERHWETKALKAKAQRDAAKFYVARKEYRGRFPW